MENLIGIKKIASLCVIKNKNKFLLLKRNNKPNKGKYVPVGGKLKGYENPLKAAIRETFEETGLKFNNLEFCGLLTETSPIDYNWISYIYLVETNSIDIPKSNEGKLKWISFQEIKNIPTPKTDDIIYRYIINKKKFIISVDYDEKIEIISMKEEIEKKNLLI
tara:strand:+ start:2516 stop:3004 length:489 start_codon:yes stop_codon:yes gene_type:complete